MTIDSERWERIRWTRKFLENLTEGKVGIANPQSARITKAVRAEAAWLLRHFPEPWWVDEQEKKP